MNNDYNLISHDIYNNVLGEMTKRSQSRTLLLEDAEPLLLHYQGKPYYTDLLLKTKSAITLRNGDSGTGRLR